MGSGLWLVRFDRGLGSMESMHTYKILKSQLRRYASKYIDREKAKLFPD